MQPIDLDRSRTARRGAPPPAGTTGDQSTTWRDAPPPAQIRIAGPALLVEAWFGDVLLASRLLRADEPAGFTIGQAPRSDAPVNPGYLPGAEAFPLVASEAGGFVLSLAPAMRASLHTPSQRLPLMPDAGAVEAPLALAPDSLLQILCGEMTFAVHPADPVATLPRPYLPPRWREEIWYVVGVALALLAFVLIARAVPEDPSALSLDDIGRTVRMANVRIVPPVIAPPPATAGAQPGGGGARAAAGPAGAAGSRTAPRRETRRAVVGPPGPRTAQQAADRIRAHSILAALSDPKAGALAEVLSRATALGGDAENVLAHMEGTTIAEAYDVGGMHQRGTGAGGGGTNEAMLVGDGLGTWGKFGPGHGKGSGPGYGDGVGALTMRHKPRPPEIVPGIASLNGTLDKEIIRRIVRRHLNEVRYCYEQALPRHPTLSGRAVVQFTIAKDGQVLASVLQSSTLGVASVESCVVSAVKRWAFPAPERGGLTMVSYPFQFTPSGG
jgi:TonB family protein